MMIRNILIITPLVGLLLSACNFYDDDDMDTPPIGSDVYRLEEIVYTINNRFPIERDTITILNRTLTNSLSTNILYNTSWEKTFTDSFRFDYPRDMTAQDIPEIPTSWPLDIPSVYDGVLHEKLRESPYVFGNFNEQTEQFTYEKESDILIPAYSEIIFEVKSIENTYRFEYKALLINSYRKRKLELEGTVTMRIHMGQIEEIRIKDL